MRALLSRVKKLQAAAEGRGCGPDCPAGLGIVYRQDGPDGEPVEVRREGTDAPCPWCGRAAEVEELVEMIISTREQADRALAGLCQQTGVERL
jgi:hypothetical protein